MAQRKFEGDGYAWYLHYGDGFIGVSHVKTSNCTLQICASLACQAYLNYRIKLNLKMQKEKPPFSDYLTD